MRILQGKWRDLKKESFKILEKKNIDDGMLLTLKDERGVLYSVHAPYRVRLILDDSEYTDIRNNGLKEKRAYYWDFEVDVVNDMNC